MTDKHTLEDRVRAYMERRAQGEVPARLDARVIDAVRARSARRRHLPELVLATAVAVFLIAALAIGIATRGRSSSSSGVAGQTPALADPCRGAPACLTIEADVSGAELLSGEQRRPVNSCTGILAVDADGAVLPRLMGELDGHSVSSFLLIPSASPGTYLYQGSTSYPADVLDVDGRHYVDAIAGVRQVASGTVVIDPDGSGAYTIRGLIAEAQPSETVTLGVSWQCTTQ